MRAAVHPDRVRVISSRPVLETDQHQSRGRYDSYERQSGDQRDSSYHPKRARLDRERSQDSERGDYGERRYDSRDDRDEGRRRYRDRRDSQHDNSAPSSSSDPIRFLSSIPLPSSSTPPPASSPFSSHPTRHVLLQSIPTHDESALHVYCHPFHCIQHRFLPSHDSTIDCVIEFSDRSWSKQFMTIHGDKLRLGGERGVHMEYVYGDYVEQFGGESKVERGGSGTQYERTKSEEEEGEVDEELEESVATRSFRLNREYDLSSLASLTSPNDKEETGAGRVLLVTGLPSDAKADALADAVRYAFAPLASVRWTAVERLNDSHQPVAFIAFHSSTDAERVMTKGSEVRVGGQPVSVHRVKRREPALSPVEGVSAGVVRPAHLPDSYQYQAETGYWMDEVTGLYFHPSTGLYWDARTQHYSAWHPATQQYDMLPHHSTTQDSSTTSTLSSTSPSTVTVAAQQAASPTAGAQSTASSSADGITPVKPTIRMTLSAPPSVKPLRPAPVTQPAPPTSTASPPPPSSPSDASPIPSSASTAPTTLTSSTSPDPASAITEPVDPALQSPLFDLTRMACLLCQRGFSSSAQLKRHVDQSQLHAKNLEVAAAKEELRLQHAAQRKPSHTLPAYTLPPPSATPSPPSVDGRQQGERSEMNVGEKLMMKLGWRAGHGLGKAEQGRAEVIEVTERTTRGGIGSAATSEKRGGEGKESGMAYKDFTKTKAMERFQAMTAAEGSGGERKAPAESDAARQYLLMLERNRAMERDGEEHRRALLK